MSGGTKPHQLAYYGEMTGKIGAARALVEEAYPGSSEAIFAAASEEARASINQAFLGPVREFRNLDDRRRAILGELQELLEETVEARDTTAADKAEARARELGVSDSDVIELIRTAADDLFDFMVTMERDHYEGAVLPELPRAGDSDRLPSVNTDVDKGWVECIPVIDGFEVDVDDSWEVELIEEPA